MSARKLAIGVAGLLAVAAVGTAVWQHRLARAAEAELAVARQRRTTLQASIVDIEGKVPTAERRAREAERDSGELLRAVEALKVAQAPRPPPANPAVVRAWNPVTAVEPGSNGPGPDEKERLMYERAHQQEMAKKRAADLKRKAELDWLVSRLPPASVFKHRIEAVEERVGKGDFQAAILILNEAMAEKPADEPLPDKVRQLQALLQEQNGRIEITFVSDEHTFVMLAGVQALGKFQRRTMTLPPGDHPVIGLRQDYEKVTLLVQVRNGVRAPAVTVICSVPARN